MSESCETFMNLDYLKAKATPPDLENPLDIIHARCCPSLCFSETHGAEALSTQIQAVRGELNHDGRSQIC